MRSYRICFFIIILGTFASCGSKKDRTYTKKEFYSNGQLASEAQYGFDSLKNGFSNTYYKAGGLHERDTYENGELNGISLTYYENGAVSQKQWYKAGTLLGSSYYYYPNGNLELYNARDYNKDVFYIVKYDSMGVRLKEEGLVISPTVSSPTFKSRYHLGDSIILEYCTANPPGCITQVNIGTYRYTDSVHRALADSFRIYPIFNSIATYRFKCARTGHYRTICKGSILDTSRNWRKDNIVHTDFVVE